MGTVKPLQIGELIARVPVIQGGMGVGISLSSLAGAVAAEGGIGIISTAQIGYREPDFDVDPIGANLRAIGLEIRKAREIARGGILGVNIMAYGVTKNRWKCPDEAGTYCIQCEISQGHYALLVEEIQQAAGCGCDRGTVSRWASGIS